MLLVAHQLGDLLDQRRLVDLVGDLGDDDALAVALLGLLDAGAAAHRDAAAAGRVRRADAGGAADDAARREVGALHELRSGPRRVRLGLSIRRTTRVDHLAQVVRRDVGRHADGDARRAVDQQVREACAGSTVGSCSESSKFGRKSTVSLSRSRQQLVGELSTAAPRCSAWRRGGSPSTRAEVALPVDERVAQREVLRHAHQRVVDRGVAVRMVLAHDVADDARRTSCSGLLARAAQLVHREEDAPVHGLEAVAHVGQRAADDDAHRVVEVRALASPLRSSIGMRSLRENRMSPEERPSPPRRVSLHLWRLSQIKRPGSRLRGRSSR